MSDRSDPKPRTPHNEKSARAPATPSRSPLDVPGVDVGITMEEIVAAVCEVRERD
jgi:hypothetical protein